MKKLLGERLSLLSLRPGRLHEFIMVLATMIVASVIVVKLPGGSVLNASLILPKQPFVSAGRQSFLAPAPPPPVPSPTKSTVITTPSSVPSAKTSTTIAPKPDTPPPAAAVTEIASEAACPGQGNVSGIIRTLICLTSSARVFHGLSAVTTHSILNAAASAKAVDIVSCTDFSHTACGHASNYWLTQKNYPSGCSAENIAQGQPTPGVVFTSWMNSAGHRANILRAGYVDIGVALQASPSGPVWVMELGGC